VLFGGGRRRGKNRDMSGTAAYKFYDAFLRKGRKGVNKNCLACPKTLGEYPIREKEESCKRGGWVF